MTENELLLAISEMMDTKLGNISNYIYEIKTRLDSLEFRVKKVELTQENDIKPILNTILACYTSTYDRYKDSVEDYEDMKQDISVLKKVVTEHSGKLKMIS